MKAGVHFPPFFFMIFTRDAHVDYNPDSEYYRRFARSPGRADEYRDWVKVFKLRVNTLERAGAALAEAVRRV